MAAAPELYKALAEMTANLLTHTSFGLNDEEVQMLKRAEAALEYAISVQP